MIIIILLELYFCNYCRRWQLYMVLIKLKGGLGNQMFQYAFGMQVAQTLDTELKLDCTSLLNRNKGDFVYRDFDLSIFNITAKHQVNHNLLKFASDLKISRLTKWIGSRVGSNLTLLKEPHFHVYEPYIEEPQDHAVYEGWFQSHRYYVAVEEQLRQEFSFRDPVIAHSRSLLQDIGSTNAICLNVRRTDFLKVDALNTTNLDYFLSGAAKMTELVDNPHFYIFSDDVAWCREHIRLDHPITIVDHSHKGHKFGNYLQLMSKCKHFIIPNSSFAYWAVWLSNQKNQHVIAPKRWFADEQYDTSDLQRKEWILM